MNLPGSLGAAIDVCHACLMPDPRQASRSSKAQLRACDICVVTACCNRLRNTAERQSGLEAACISLFVPPADSLACEMVSLQNPATYLGGPSAAAEAQQKGLKSLDQPGKSKSTQLRRGLKLSFTPSDCYHDKLARMAQSGIGQCASS